MVITMNKDFQEQQMFLDDKDFFSKFIFNPDIQEDADYKHLDKNLAITKLDSRFKEPEKARSLLRALHILSNPKYFRSIKERLVIGYEDEEVVEIDEEGNKIFIKKKIPVYQENVKKISFYPKAYHSLKSRFYALTTTSMARDGHLLKGASTKHFNRSESIEDRTERKSNFFGLRNPADRDY